MQRYPDVDPQQSFPDLEQQVLRRWKEERTFERSVAQRPAGKDGANEYVFYEARPSRTGCRTTGTC
jgi:isoleucyl-tRNA synthetase